MSPKNLTQARPRAFSFLQPFPVLARADLAPGHISFCRSGALFPLCGRPPPPSILTALQPNSLPWGISLPPAPGATVSHSHLCHCHKSLPKARLGAGRSCPLQGPQVPSRFLRAASALPFRWPLSCTHRHSVLGVHHGSHGGPRTPTQSLCSQPSLSLGSQPTPPPTLCPPQSHFSSVFRVVAARSAWVPA